MSESHKNQIGYWKEKYRSKETKEKIGNANKGRIPTKEHKEKIGNANKGKKRSEEMKKKISEANKGRICSKETRAKLSNANKGKVISEETKRKMSKATKGNNNPNWQGGIAFEPYSIQFSKELKELIRNRDNYKCQFCSMPECENIKKLSIHHIDYSKKNCLPSNLISLCVGCNSKVNANRTYWTKYFANLLKNKELMYEI